MKVENRVFPNREQMKGFFENTDDNEELVLHTDVKRLAVGKVEELWDVVAIAKWPSRKIMGENMMPSDPEYLEAYQHREAGLAGQLNIETKEIND